MHLLPRRRSLFSISSKFRLLLIKPIPLFVTDPPVVSVVEPLEARRLLSASLGSPPAALQPAVAPALAYLGEITASDSAVGAYFGCSVAISGNTAVAGAPGANNGHGVAYVFTRSGLTWYQVAELTDPNDGLFDTFGNAVAISGNTVVIAAPGVNSDQGAAYVFTQSGSTWNQVAELTSSDPAADFIGSSVAIGGNTIVVGAYATDVNGNLQQGAAYVFTEPGNGWANMTQTSRLTAADGAATDCFGSSVSIDGNTIAVGAPGDFSGQTGKAYVFAEPGAGWGNMTQTAELTSSDSSGDDEFGESVSISGNTVVVGARLATAGQTGAAYVFTESGSGWADMTQTAELTASDSAQDDYFGHAVSISGNTVAVGATEANGSQGEAYVFTEPAAGWENMTQTSTVTASNGAAGDNFGDAVAISDGTLAIGAQYAAGGGAVYTYAVPPTITAVATTATPGSTYNLGGTVPITVTFSQAVNVTGTPQLTLNDGGVANYASGSGTTTLTFDYVPAAGQNTSDLDYTSTSALALNGGSIQDATANAATLTLPATGTDGLAVGNIIVDTSQPDIVTVSTTATAKTLYTADATVPITITFNEAMKVMGTPQLTLNDGGVASYASGSGTTTLTFNYVVAAGQNTTDLDYSSTSALSLPNGSSIDDSLGGTAALTLPATGTDGLAVSKIIIDTSQPSIVVVSTTAVAKSQFTVGATVPITITFNEAMSVTGTPQLALNDGGIANYANGSGTTVLTFDYVVATGQNTADLDYSSTSSLILNSGSIVDTLGGAASLTLPATGTDWLATHKLMIGTVPTPVLGNLSVSSSIPQGAASVAFSGTIAAGTLIPPSTESVAITLNGVTQDAAINANGNFSTTFNTSTLPASNTPYQVTYTYAGDANFNSTADNTTTTLLVMPTSGTETSVWRLYSSVTKEHLYTADLNEYNTLGTRGWDQEGLAYDDYTGLITIGGVTTEPLYRLYNIPTQQHLWTTDPNEYNTLKNFVGTWSVDGISGYIFPANGNTSTSLAAVPGSAALYRMSWPFNPSADLHLWTTDLNEYNTDAATYGWTKEGVIGYVM